jgi:hypothetical protein
MDIEIG